MKRSALSLFSSRPLEALADARQLSDCLIDSVRRLAPRITKATESRASTLWDSETLGVDLQPAPAQQSRFQKPCTY